MLNHGIEDAYIVESTVNFEVFLTFIQPCLLPIIQPFDGGNPRSIVVLENASIRHVEEAVKLRISAAGAIVRF